LRTYFSTMIKSCKLAELQRKKNMPLSKRKFLQTDLTLSNHGTE
jgi:hypothetical protein